VMMISVIMVMMMAHEQKRDSLRGNWWEGEEERKWYWVRGKRIKIYYM
jgi:hypothetical protein